LARDTAPEVLLAEPVGSCTDLVATVSLPLARIYGDRFTVAPVSVVVDPLRALRILGADGSGDGGGFSPNVAYIYRKQLEEAEIVVINKCDLVSPAQRSALRAARAATLARLAGVFAEAAAIRRGKTISIFHTTDLHGRILPTSSYEGLDDVGGFARCASCIRQWRRESPHSITVDVGDVVQGTAVSMQSGGRLMIDLFNRLGYDAWALGNHDFDWGPEKLEVLLAASSAPILTANITRGGRPPGGLAGGWEKVRPWIIREVGGFRIGLIGLITPGLDFWLSAETLGGVEATDPAATLAATVKEVRDAGADAVVALGHMGWRFHDDYANPVRTVLRAAEGVDVYLAGHSHQNQPSWTLHDVLCSQASYYGIHCGRIDLTFDLDSRRLVDRRGFTLLMDDRFALDPLVIEMARPDLASSD
jgi:2',3'-cyclic-nucleotide 2'-phosphodiesterase (5'-nucleotidase family)